MASLRGSLGIPERKFENEPIKSENFRSEFRQVNKAQVIFTS